MQRPPQLCIKQDVNGKVTIEPDNSGWNYRRQNMNGEYKIYYTTDGQ